MRRLFYKGLLADEIKITGEDAAHIMYSMRAKKGERLTVVDDVNAAAIMETVAFDKEGVTLGLIERLPPPEPPAQTVTLAQCLLKGDKTELVIQKATELGACKIVPLVSRNTVVRPDAQKAAAKTQRWRKQAAEAAKQCGSASIPEVTPPMSLEEFLTNLPPNATLIFCYENETQTDLATALRATQKDIILLIGAEGGFTLAEAERIKAAGGVSAGLGRRIMRAETAAIVALAITQYEKGEI